MDFEYLVYGAVGIGVAGVEVFEGACGLGFLDGFDVGHGGVNDLLGGIVPGELRWGGGEVVGVCVGRYDGL